jgi:hypothetical protein
MNNLASQRKWLRAFVNVLFAGFTRLGWKTLLSALGLLCAFLIARLPWESLGAPLVVLFVTGGISFALIWMDSNLEERPFTARLFLIALGAHLAVMGAFWIASGGLQTYWLKDARAYDNVGWAIAQAWQAGLAVPSGLGSLAWVASDTYPQLVGALYYLMGHAPLAMLAFQSVLGACIVYLTYRIAAQVLGPITARMAGWLAIVYTGFLLFSIIILKESLSLVLILACVYIWYRFQKKIDQPLRWQEKVIPLLLWGFIGAAAIAGVHSLRDYTAQVILGAWVLGVCHLLVRYSRRWRWATLALIVLASALIVWWQFPNIMGKSLPPITLAPGSTLVSVAEVPVTGTIKGLLHWIRTRPSSFSIYMLSASASTLIAPFAWIFPGATVGAPEWSIYLLSYPGMWIWYLCIPFAFFGVISSLRRTHGDILPMLFYALVMFLVFSLLIPRESRHRDMMMPFALILAAEGLVFCRHWTAAGFLIWVPLVGFMAWKLNVLLPTAILLAVASVFLFIIFTRHQRSARLSSRDTHL